MDAAWRDGTSERTAGTGGWFSSYIMRQGKQAVIDSIDESLCKLNMDYIDLLLGLREAYLGGDGG